MPDLLNITYELLKNDYNSFKSSIQLAEALSLRHYQVKLILESKKYKNKIKLPELLKETVKGDAKTFTVYFMLKDDFTELLTAIETIRKKNSSKYKLNVK